MLRAFFFRIWTRRRGNAEIKYVYDSRRPLTSGVTVVTD